MTKQAKASCTLCHYVFEHDNSWFWNVLSQVDQDVDQDMIRSNRKSRDFGTWTWPRFVSNRFGRFQGHLDQLRIETLEDGCILHRTCELRSHDILKKRYFLSWNRPCSRDLRTFSSVHWYSSTVGSCTPPILLQLHAWCESLLALEWEEDGINTNCQRKFNPVDVDDVQTTTGSKLN